MAEANFSSLISSLPSVRYEVRKRLRDLLNFEGGGRCLWCEREGVTRSLTRLIFLRVMGVAFSDDEADASNLEALILEIFAAGLEVCETDFDLTASCHSQIMVRGIDKVGSQGPKILPQKL